MERKLLLPVLAAVVISASAYAGEIYKYVDNEGTVHYVDRPTGETGEERLDVSYAATTSGSVNAQIKRHQEYMDARREARAEDEKRREAEAEARTEQEERAARCQEYRARLESYLQSRRLYRESETGDREYLNEAETLDARRKLEDLIQENCS